MDFSKVEETPLGRKAPLLVQIDLAKRLDITGLVDEVGARLRPVPGVEHAWTDGETTLQWVERADGKPRLVIGTGFGTDPRNSAVFHGLPAPRLRKSEQQILETAREGFAYGFCRLGPFAGPNEGLRKMLGFVGPQGLTFGAALRVQDGRLSIIAESGIRVGAGILGMALPPRAGDAGSFGGFRGELGTALLVDLGEGVQQSLGPAINLLLAGSPAGKETKDALHLLARSWSGRAAAYASAIQVGRMAAFLEVEATSSRSTLDAVEALLRRMFPGVSRSKTGRIRFGVGNGKASVGVEDRLLTFYQVMGAGAGDPEPPARPPAPTIPLLAVEQAPVKLWIGANVVEQARRRSVSKSVAGSAAYRLGYKFGSELLFSIIEKGLMISVNWDRRRTRLVVRFP
ncbi:MAG: hypothetical protein KDC87_05790 [Planctomycetes bacterium]|nr:hypothetical protein [Planctomycetota bacterium]